MSAARTEATRRRASEGEPLKPADAGRVLDEWGAAVYEWDLSSDRLSWSDGAAALLGLSDPAQIATGNRFARFVDPSGPPGRDDAVFGAEPDGARDYQALYRFQPPSAVPTPPLWVEDRGRCLIGEDGKPERAVGLVRIVSDRCVQDRAEESEHGVVSRARLVQALEDALAGAVRSKGQCGFTVVAVDNLGAINDTYGYGAGDEVIAGVAARIAATMRRADAIGRLAGNKLGIVLRECSEADLRTAAERFSSAVAEAPLETGKGAVAVTVSIGTVLLPRYARDADEALGRAKEALAAARRRGITCISAYEPSARRDAERSANAAMIAEVVAALNAGRVGLALQPVVDAHSGRIAFHEALCRLRTEDGRCLSPADFIEAAERLGMIRLLDHRVLDLAIAALRQDTALTLSVNLSACSALYGGWLSKLAAHLRGDKRLASRLIVEITETVAIADLEQAVSFVSGVKDLGGRTAMDDFGAGHTSFRNLRALNLDIVKIDGSFIEGIATSEDDRVFVSALSQLARHMGLTTVAERVTNDDDAATLREIGIDCLQGHLIGDAVDYPGVQADACPATNASLKADRAGSGRRKAAS